MPEWNRQQLAEPMAAWFGSEPVTAEPLGEGHINSTYLVSAEAGQFVLQRISPAVFAEPQVVVANQALLFECAGADESWPYVLPENLPTLAGSPVTETVDATWRLSRYVAQSRTLQTLVNGRQARAAGQAFGAFQRLVRNLDSTRLRPVIAGFHELAHYLFELEQAQERAAATAGLPAEAPLLSELLSELRRRVPHYQAAEPTADVVIHGDCKVNNLLFAPLTDRVIALLDLDTLMVGPWWLDFGDLVRSAVVDEDGEFRADYYSALANGFFAASGGLRAADLDAALRAPAYMAYMLCMRFVADHLNGDQYFNVAYPGENLRRAERQFESLCRFESAACQAEMRAVLAANVTRPAIGC